MQLDRRDHRRYDVISRRTTIAGRKALKDLRSNVPGHVVMHCEGSGYRLQRSNGKPLILRGAHGILQRCLWSGERFGGKSSGKSVTRFSDGRTYYGSAGGLARGKDVHAQIGDFIMLRRKQYNARYPEVDLMTHAALQCLAKGGYLGVHAEYIVYHERLRLGTAVDLVCLDRQGKLVFVEVKTGYQDAFLQGKKNAMLRGPFPDIEDTPLNRARTQLLYAQALYSDNHAYTPRGLVLHVARDGKAMLFGMGPLANAARHKTSLLQHIESMPTPKRGGKRKRKSAPSDQEPPAKRRK